MLCISAGSFQAEARLLAGRRFGLSLARAALRCHRRESNPHSLAPQASPSTVWGTVTRPDDFAGGRSLPVSSCPQILGWIHGTCGPSLTLACAQPVANRALGRNRTDFSGLRDRRVTIYASRAITDGERVLFRQGCL